MVDQLTRADIAKMPPQDVEMARQKGQLDEVLGGGQGGTKDAEKKQIDRRAQKPRSDMLNLDSEGFEERLQRGDFDSVLEGATHVLDCATGSIYEVTGTNEGDLSPIVKAKDAAGEDREDLAEKLFTDWVPLTNDIYLVAREAMDDPEGKAQATKKPLPLKPAYEDAIKNGEMVVVDPDNFNVLVQFPNDKDKKDQNKLEKDKEAAHIESQKAQATQIKAAHTEF